MIRKFFNFKFTPLFSVRVMRLIACILLLLYVVSCNSDDSTPSPSGSFPLDPISSLTLSGVDESSITLSWDLLKTEEGVVDPTIAYTVYAETNDEKGVFIKNPDTETVYTLTGENPLSVDDTGRIAGITVANLTNNTPYRIVVVASISGSTSRTELLAYTASTLVEADLSGVGTSTIPDSDEVTVTWDPKSGAQAYLIQANEDEIQIGNDVLADKVLALVCPPKSLLCENEDRFAQLEDDKLKYTLRVNKKGKYTLAVVPVNFRDLSGFQVIAEGQVRTFSEEVLARVADVNSDLSSRLQSALNDNAQEFPIQVSRAEAPTDLVLDSTENTLSASWGHGTGAEYYHAILTNDGFTVTNTIDRYEASGRFAGGGYAEFSNLTLNTVYTVTVQSLTVINHITNVITNVGGMVSATLSTKDAPPEAVVNLAVTGDDNRATVTWEESPVGNPATKYVLEYLTEVTTPITHIDVAGEAADTELSGLSWEEAASVEVMTNDSGKYSSLVSNLNVSSATNVFRVKGVRDATGEEWASAYRYYALGTELSRAPSSVGELSFSEHDTNGSFKVTWARPDDPGQDRSKAAAQLVGYRVAWGTTAEVDGGSNDIADPDTSSYTVTNLTPGIQYYVKVQARNDNTEGYIYNIGSLKSTYTIKSPREVMAPSIVYSEHTTNGFKVSWDAVTDTGYGPEGKFPSVRYEIQLSNSQGTNWQSITRSDDSATEETLTGLLPGTGYTVRIQSFNGFSDSENNIITLNGNTIEGGEAWTFSLPGQVESMMISDPNYDETNHLSGFKVSWTPPSDTGIFSDGSTASLTGYEITYVEVVEGIPGEYTSITYGETTTEHLFTDLKPNTTYSIGIQARTAAGAGVEGYLYGWTPSPPGAVDPNSITLSFPTTSTIEIEWKASEPGRVGGESSSNAITSYKVEIVPEGANEGDYIPVQDDYFDTVITASNLDSSTFYRARVTAKNTWGAAEASISTNRVSTASLDPTPPAAVGELKVTSFTDSEVVLSWIAPTNTGTVDGNVATLIGYEVKYRETAKSNFIEIDGASEGVRLAKSLGDTNTTTAIVINLNPSTSYTFLVVAVHSGMAGLDTEVPQIEQTTAVPPPGNLGKTSPCLKTDSVELAWPVSPGAISYNLYRGGKAISNINTTNYTDTGLSAGMTYTYTVRACKDTACSGDSDPLTITTLSNETFKSIIDSGRIPEGLTDYDPMSQEIFDYYQGGASNVAKYVKEGGSGDESGSSFKNAAKDLKTVLDGINSSATNVYVVFLAGGTYSITQTISMKNHVAIVGGVDECLGSSGTVTALDGGGIHQVFSNKNLNHTALLYGVTVTNGNSDNGGGMYNASSSPSLTRVTFSGNRAVNLGGGMFNGSSSPSLTWVTFSGNGASDGGGMYNTRSSPSLIGVTFSGNGFAVSGGEIAISGGGMYNITSSSPSLIGVTFSGNVAEKGGGMYSKSSSPSLIGVTFTENGAYDGGGMYNDNNGAEGPTIVNSIFWGNHPSSQIHFLNNKTDQENLRIYNSIVAGGTGDLESGETNTSLNQRGGGFGSYSAGNAPIVISFANITNADPKLKPLEKPLEKPLDAKVGSVATHAIPSDSPAKNQGLFVKRKGEDYYYSTSGEVDEWYKNPNLTEPGTPPDGAEDLTATDATGRTRTDRPDIGAYEYR